VQLQSRDRKKQQQPEKEEEEGVRELQNIQHRCKIVVCKLKELN
jgi:hypothetical protein